MLGVLTARTYVQSMEYDPSGIEVLSAPELIRKRPGMFLGGVGRVAAATLITCAADVLCGLTVNRSGAQRPLIYSHHAFLDVSLVGHRSMVVLDFNASECPDFDERCSYLIANREFLWASDLETRSGNDIATFPIVSALSTGMVIKTRTAAGPRTVLQDESNVDVTFPPLVNDSQVAIAFDLWENLDLSEISQDFLDGFIRGNRNISGVLIRSVTHKAQ